MPITKKRGASLPSPKTDYWERIEPINPDSLTDAFEVESDGIDRIFLKLLNW